MKREEAQMRILKDEDGQVLVLTVLSATLLLACVALAVDVGTLFNAKRKVQIAADAAAVAGALEWEYNGSSNAPTNAKNAAQANGITDANQVSVNLSGGGYHTGSGFVEVVVRQPNPTFFMGMFMPGQVNVAARAVAGVTPNPSCVILLNPSAPGALSAKGAFTVNSTGCGWDVNSNDPQALCVTGNGNNGSFNAPYVRFRASSLKNKGSCNGSLSSPIFTGASLETDPLNSLGNPTPCDHTVSAGTLTVGDANSGLTGVVCFTNPAGVQISGNGKLGDPAGSTPTIFVFNNGVEIMTGANITVPSGTFDIAGGALKEKGGQSCVGNKTTVGMIQDSNSTLNINAPTDTANPYHGIAIMEPYNDTSPLEVQFGSNSGNYGSGQLDGLIYAPSATVYLHDNGGGTTATGLIADSLDVCSSTLTINSYNTAAGNASPLVTVALVE
jgi:hypothetical protein